MCNSLHSGTAVADEIWKQTVRLQRICVCCIESANEKDIASVCNMLLFIGQHAKVKAVIPACRRERVEGPGRGPQKELSDGVPIFNVG